ncbi:hypothetical protein BZG36_05133, partial [Bifiguratus adelaidae]
MSDTTESLELNKMPKLKKEPTWQDQSVVLPPVKLAMVYLGLALAVFVSATDLTIVSTALPNIASTFNASSQIGWVPTSYMLTSTVCAPLYGKFSDIFGRRTLYLFALSTFLGGSIISGASQDIIMLIVFRAIQGIGGGGISAMNSIIVSDIVSLRDRGKYQGAIGAMADLVNDHFPKLGGVFTDHVSWRWCFYINLPVGAITIVVSVLFLKLRPVTGDTRAKFKRIDGFGTFLLVGSVVCILLAVQMGGNQFAWNSSAIVSCFVVGGVVLIGFIIWEARYANEPVVPMRLFRLRTPLATFLAMFFLGFPFYTWLYYLPIYFQVVRGDSATSSGLELLPFLLGLIITSIVSGILVSKTGRYRIFFWLGGACVTAGSVLIHMLDAISTRGDQIGFLLLVGIGIGASSQTLIIAAQSSVPYRDIATTTAMNNFFRTIGGVFGIAIASALFNNSLSNNLAATLSANHIDVTLTSAESSFDYIQQISDPVAKQAIIQTYVDALRAVNTMLIPCSALFFIATWFVQHHELCKKVGTGDTKGGSAEKAEQGADGEAQAVDVAEVVANSANVSTAVSSLPPEALYRPGTSAAKSTVIVPGPQPTSKIFMSGLSELRRYPAELAAATMGNGPTWKREQIQDHKFDFVDVEEFHDSSLWMNFRYMFVFLVVLKAILVYMADLWTAGYLLVSGSGWSSAINPTTYLNSFGISSAVPKWVYVGCIALSFILLAIDVRKARMIIESRDISYAFTSIIVSRYYSLKGYDYYCFFQKIHRSKRISDELAFFVFFSLKSWKRVLFAEGPRQAVAGLTLFSIFKGIQNVVSVSQLVSNQSALQTWQSIFHQLFYTFFKTWSARFTLVLMFFTCLMWIFSMIQLVTAMLIYLPLLSHIQGNLKEYCCHNIDKRITELLAKQQKERAKGKTKRNKKGSPPLEGVQPTLPDLTEVLTEKDYAGDRYNDPYYHHAYPAPVYHKATDTYGPASEYGYENDYYGYEYGVQDHHSQAGSDYYYQPESMHTTQHQRAGSEGSHRLLDHAEKPSPYGYTASNYGSDYHDDNVYPMHEMASPAHQHAPSYTMSPVPTERQYAQKPSSNYHDQTPNDWNHGRSTPR